MKKKVKIYLAWPTTGKREDIHMYLLRDLEKFYGDQVELVLPEACCFRIFHDAARNGMVEDFLQTDCDILWFLDSDVCPPSSILDLVTDKGDDWLCAGAPYPLWMDAPGTGSKSILFTAYKGVLNKNQGIFMADCPLEGAEWVDALATGCLFIKREVFAKLEKPYFEFKFDPITRRIVEGEDLGFALKLHALGIQFWCDYSKVCKHYKNVDLLELNNYAMEREDGRFLAYDKEIRPQVQAGLSNSYKKGYEDALQDMEKKMAEARGPKRTQSGLILPS